MTRSTNKMEPMEGLPREKTWYSSRPRPVGQDWMAQIIDPPTKDSKNRTCKLTLFKYAPPAEELQVDLPKGKKFAIVDRGYQFAVVGNQNLFLYSIPQGQSPTFQRKRSIKALNEDDTTSDVIRFNDRYLARLLGERNHWGQLQFIDCEQSEDVEFTLDNLLDACGYTVRLVAPNRLVILNGIRFIAGYDINLGTHGKKIGVPTDYKKTDPWAFSQCKDWYHCYVSGDGHYVLYSHSAKVHKRDPEKKSYAELQGQDQLSGSTTGCGFLPDNKALFRDYSKEGVSLGVFNPATLQCTELTSYRNPNWLQNQFITPEGDVVCALEYRSHQRCVYETQIFPMRYDHLNLDEHERKLASGDTSKLTEAVVVSTPCLPRGVQNIVLSCLVRYSLVGVLANREAQRQGFQVPHCFSEKSRAQIKIFMDNSGHEAEKEVLKRFIDHVKANHPNKSVQVCFDELVKQEIFKPVFGRFFSTNFENLIHEICQNENTQVKKTWT